MSGREEPPYRARVPILPGRWSFWRTLGRGTSSWGHGRGLGHAPFEVAATFEDRSSQDEIDKAIVEYLVREIIGVDCLAKL